VKVNRRFEGTHRLHLQGKTLHHEKTSMLQAESFFLPASLFKPEDESDNHRTIRRYIPEDLDIKFHTSGNCQTFFFVCDKKSHSL
jgi:hypothetical protein